MFEIKNREARANQEMSLWDGQSLTNRTLEFMSANNGWVVNLQVKKAGRRAENFRHFWPYPDDYDIAANVYCKAVNLLVGSEYQAVVDLVEMPNGGNVLSR